MFSGLGFGILVIMKIRYTKHAGIDKFAILSRHKVKVTKRQVRDTILYPDHVESGNDKDQRIASKTIDVNHVLRVVYRRDGDILVVITFYPARVGRYYEN